MSKNYLRAYTNKDFRAGDPGDPIRFTASTEGIKRDGIELKADDWFLDDFNRNPVFLWVHDYFGNKPPIGKVSGVEVGKSRLDVEVIFDQQDEFARAIEGKYRRGFLNAVSVGWGIKEIGEETKNDLLDISAVPVPGDPDALMERQYRALQELYESAPPNEVDNLLDPETGEVVWSRVAVSMMQLFRSSSSSPDEERLKGYKTLRRKYLELDKTPPEFRTLDELGKLTPELIQGLFLEGEIEIAPWVLADLQLSRQEAASLKDAIAILQEISDNLIPKDENQAETDLDLLGDLDDPTDPETPGNLAGDGDQEDVEKLAEILDLLPEAEEKENV